MKIPLPAAFFFPLHARAQGSLRSRALGIRGAVVALLLVAGCDSGPSAPSVVSVRIDAPAPAVVIGTSVQLTAVPLDASGNAIEGLPVTWSSSADQVLQVTSGGLATGLTTGSATARAEVQGITGSRSLQVTPIPVATLDVTPGQIELVRGDELLLDVTARDAQGNPLPGRIPIFQSASTQVATVSPAGRVIAVRAGSTEITVRSGDAITIVPITVLPGDEPIIEGLSDSPLREGAEVNIDGQRFSPVPAQNTVRIGGQVVQVVSAEATRLRVRLPDLLCHPTGLISVTVEVGGDESAIFTVPFEADGGIAMEPGEFLRIPGGSPTCLRFLETSGPGSYLVGVQSVSPNPASVTPLVVTGTRASGGASTALAAASLEGTSEGQGGAGRSGALQVGMREPVAFESIVQARLASNRPTQALLRRHQEAEHALRGREAELLGGPLAGVASLVARGAGASAAQRQTQPGAAGQVSAQTQAQTPVGAAIPASAQVGDTVSLNIPNLRPDVSFCDVGIPIRAVVRRVGDRSIWLEDLANPGGALSAGDYTALGNQLDDLTLPRLENQFGTLTDVDANGRVVIVISEQVNRFGGILGFVVSSDFYATSICPASNTGEFYYSVTPDPDGLIPVASGGSPVRLDVDDFRSLTPRLAAHETTHIIQFGRQIVPGAPVFGQIWELEGQAVLAEEVVGLASLSLGQRQNLGFDVAFNTSESSPTDWFANGFVDLAVYYGFVSPTQRRVGAPSACGWLGRQETSGPCNNGRLAYGVAWSFLRWLSDHYGSQFPGGEAELHRRLVEATVPGFPAIEQVVGEPIAPLLAWWAAALYADGRLPGSADPRLTFPSWDLRAIDAGLVETAQLEPVARDFVSFSATVSVAAGSSYYTRLGGSSHPGFALRAAGAAGGNPPGHIQLWVVRLD